MQKCLLKDVVVIYPLTVVLFLIPVCLGFYRPLNMKDIEIIFYIDFITFFYICSEYTSLSKWFSILLSLSFTIYTILLALQVNIQLQKFRDENPFKKDDDQKKKKKGKNGNLTLWRTNPSQWIHRQHLETKVTWRTSRKRTEV